MRLERDELLAETRHGWIARLGGAADVPPGFHLGATFERSVGGKLGARAAGRIRAALARTWSGRSVAATLGAGAEIGGLWRETREYRATAASFALELARTLTLGASLGRERDLYSARRWTDRSAFWIGVGVSRVSAQLRVASQPGEAGSTLGVAATITR